MNRVDYVNAKFKPLGREKTVKVPTGETTKGITGRIKAVTRYEKQWEQTGWSDREIDGHRLAEDINKTIQALNSDGFEVISITPITSGDYSWHSVVISGGGYGYGYGFSYTECVIITLRKIT